MDRVLRTYRIVVLMALAACSGEATSSGNNGQPGNQPDNGAPGLHLTAGNNATDTVGGRPLQALTVVVRQPDGTKAIGTVVRFQSIAAAPPRQYEYPVLVGSLASPNFSSFVSDTTDSSGSAGAVVGFSDVAGQGLVQISVPTFGFADTARYTISPGNLARLVATPADTQVFLGGTVQVRASVQDTWGNPRNDPITYSVVGSNITVDGSGMATATGSGVGSVIAHAGPVADTVNIGVIPQAAIAAYRAQTNPEGIVVMSTNATNVAFVGTAVVTDWAPSPTWDPSGTHVVFSSNHRLYITPADATTSPTQLINPSAANMVQEDAPQIARTTGIVFFTGQISGSPLSIWRTNADGSSPTQVLADAGHSYKQPSPSPDGTRIAVVEDNSTIRVLDAGSQTLSPWSVQGACPQWSPVGNQIAYMTNSSVHVINADGTGDHMVSPAGHSYNPWTFGWSPDAHWLVTHSDYPGGLELIDATTGRSILIQNSGNYFYPTWKP